MSRAPIRAPAGPGPGRNRGTSRWDATTRISGSCYCISPRSSTACRRARSTSCSPDTCTTGRSACRIRAASSGSRTSRRATRAASTARRPASDDAFLVTCAYLSEPTTPWVMQSLFLTAIGEARERHAPALEAFAYRYREGESAYERFEVHRTVFPRDFLADFGFRTLRAQGRVELCRLELGGLQPVLEGKRVEVLRKLREAFAPPAPVPQRIP